MSTRPEGIIGEALDKGEFPTEAFKFTKPSAASPTLALVGWTLSVPSIAVSNCTLVITTIGGLSAGTRIAVFIPK